MLPIFRLATYYPQTGSGTSQTLKPGDEGYTFRGVYISVPGCNHIANDMLVLLFKGVDNGQILVRCRCISQGTAFNSILDGDHKASAV